MLAFDLPLVPPPDWPAADLVLPDEFDLSFEGFGEEAFGILDRLRAHPRIEQYRQEKVGIRRYLTDPFKRYRDDLVVNWVLPNRLDFETEKNVFSRLLKNDFGAGGCHHHLWLSFYRPGRRRLTDFQLTHSLSPDGLTLGLYVGDYAQDLVRQARARILQQPARFLSLVNPLLPPFRFFFYTGSGKTEARHAFTEPLDAVPEEIGRATGLWLRTRIPRAEVLRLQGALVRPALEAIHAVWPVYRFYSAGAVGLGRRSRSG